MPEPINLAAKFALIDEHWSPRVVGELNGNMVKLAKIKGEFVWHHHENEDELFLVVKGRMLMRLREGDQWVEEGEMIIIPRGVEHCPVAEDECHIMLFEPAGTLNTGNVDSDRTGRDIKQISTGRE